MKVSGKLSARDTLASLYAVDELPPAAAGAGPAYANVAAVRYKRGLGQDSYAGGYYTGRTDVEGYNHVAGADGNIRLDRSSALSFYAFTSSTGGPGRPGMTPWRSTAPTGIS